VIFSDCNSIKSYRNKVELSPRIYRRWEFLQSFEFEIEYREGKRMAHVDFRWSVINQVHESIMHLGWEKTLESV